MRHIGFSIDHGGLHYSEILSLAKHAEELGYDSISFYDHLYSLSGDDEICLETWSMFPAISLNTRKIKLVPLVTNNLFRHPGVLAKMAATVDNLSKGRLIFGIGAGWYEKEARDFGYDFPDLKTRIEMLDECIQMATKLWTEDKSTFQGKHYKLENAESLPKPFQKPHPLILVGGKSKGILKIVARYADMSNFTLRELGIEGCKKKLEQLKEYCSNIGRDYGSISKTISGPCIFARSAVELETELEDCARERETTKEDLKQFYFRSGLFGAIDQITDQLKEYEKIGIDGAFLRFNKSKQDEKSKLFAETVFPQIRN